MSAIRDLLGHSSAAVTDRYLRRLGASDAVEFARRREWRTITDSENGEATPSSRAAGGASATGRTSATENVNNGGTESRLSRGDDRTLIVVDRDIFNMK